MTHKAESQYDRDVTALLVIAGGVEHVHVSPTITLMSLNVFTHQLKGYTFSQDTADFFIYIFFYLMLQ